MPPPVVLTIAGFDPSSGAGITADLKTFAAHRCYGLACMTAITVQNTRHVQRVEPLAPRLVRQTLHELLSDFEVHAVKVGMLGSADVARTVLLWLRQHDLPHVVIDPVLHSSSGATLLEPSGLKLLRKMLPLAEVVTPNANEAAALAGMPNSRAKPRQAGELKLLAERLHDLGARNVVVTGGDVELTRGKAIDVFSTIATRPAPGKTSAEELVASRSPSSSTHGTGCAFSSAIAANLAQGQEVRQAIVRAKRYVTEAIRTAPNLGHGRGPLNHFFLPRRHGENQ